MPKYFTKSAFKVALNCPWALFYYGNPNQYANANQGDEFLEALAEGGFQVGELAKIYCGVDADADLKDILGYTESLERTAELMKRDKVTIAEAAFKINNMFVRVDILKKDGNNIELIEVKAKSWNSEKDSFLGKRPKNTIKKEIRPYVYDVAFQKYVVSQALSEYNIKAFLMMADKTKKADVNGLNQLFKISRNTKNRAEATMVDGAETILAGSAVQVLTAYDIDDICTKIIAGETAEQKDETFMRGLGFKEFVRRATDCYCGNTQYDGKPELCGECIKCAFHKSPSDSSSLRDGKRECWLQHTTANDYDHRPLLETMNGANLSTNRDKWIREGIYFMDQLDGVMNTCASKKASKPGLDHYQRKWLQIGLETNNKTILNEYAEHLNGTTYLDKEGLRAEMDSWKYPLHMIDFETTAVALPYYKGMHPYEQVAFQFSHHIIREDGSIEHVGQYLNEDVTKFPNFEFVRKLKEQLEGDDGTIFRYATHENTILRAIAEQLKDSDEADKEELIKFIRTITHNNRKEEGDKYAGERDMVDLLEIVKLYFYNLEEMHGSNSIKQVLPAVLNCSQYLKDKYSQPIYGKEIKSCNIPATAPKTWITFDANSHVDSPYHQLENVGDLINMTEQEMDKVEAFTSKDSDFSVANGGAALTAYNKLMFCGDNTTMDDALRQALLRYCELDTMSMVFIWEYFHNEIFCAE